MCQNYDFAAINLQEMTPKVASLFSRHKKSQDERKRATGIRGCKGEKGQTQQSPFPFDISNKQKF